MKSFSSQFTSNLLRKKEPGLSEILTLINFDEEPCSLVDLSTNTILIVNSRFMKLTSYSSNEICKKPIEKIFPKLDLKVISSGSSQELIINCRDGNQIQTFAKFNYFEPEIHWMLIRLTTKTSAKPTLEKPNEPVFKILREIVSTIESQEISIALNKVAELTQKTLNAGMVCIYQADSSNPLLVLTSKSGFVTEFPAKLPSTDLIRLTETILWEPGHRVITEIHRFAKSANLDYMATAVLKQEDAKIGLIVVSGKGDIPVELHLDILDLIAELVTNSVQQSLLIRNLENKNCEIAENVTLQNTLIENMQEGVIVLTPQLKISQVNPAAEWMLGYADNEIKGQDYANILIGADRITPALADAQRGNESLDIGKAFLNRRSGQTFPVQIRIIPVMSGKQVKNIEILITDISENEQSKAVAKHLEQRAIIGDFTAAIAHDARNPLNSISAGVQLLANRLPADDPNQETINMVLSDCGRLGQLIESFLTYARPDSMEHSEVDLAFFLQRMVDRWRPRFSHAKVTPVVSFEANLPKVKGDPRSLDRVFSNLILNAIEVMTGTGGILGIKGILNNEIPGHPQVEINISDNGPGIPEELQQHIFEPFLTTRKDGFGLGLAITKKIVTAHKGSISVNSFPGGTVFTVKLPADNGELA
jgi:two-component system sensor histidine kinase AtoS